MSTNGGMGAIEAFEWQCADGRVMSVTVNRGLLALLLEKKMRAHKKGKGSGPGVRVSRVSRLEGAIVARCK
jgi:hypothetical protein